MKKQLNRLLSVVLVLVLTASLLSTAAFAKMPAAEVTDEEVLGYAYWDTSLSDEERAADLISHMTVAEKASQLGSHPGKAIDRLGVAEYWYPGENLNGIANISLWYGKEAGDAKSAASSFPSTLAQGSTWNVDLIGQMGNAIGDEARAFYNTSKKGLSHWGPSVNLARDPRWGRTGDSFTEDVLLSGALSVAFIQGFQGDLDDNSDYLKAIACIKHFAANNAEVTRNNGSSNMSEAELREYYLRHFDTMVQDADPACVMAAYNSINSIPCHGDYELLTNVLRLTWGFDGWVVSDNTGVENLSGHYGINGKNVAKEDAVNFPVLTGADTNWNGLFNLKVDTEQDAAVAAIRSGVSLDLRVRNAYQLYLAEAVELGMVEETVLDEALLEVFTTRFATGEFDFADDYTTGYQSVAAFIYKHEDLAQQIADEAIVLLENKDNFLPADIGAYQSIVVVGQYLNELLYSDYKSEPAWRDENGINVSYAAGITEAVEAYNKAHGTSVNVELCNLVEVKDEETGESYMELPDDGQGGQGWNRLFTEPGNLVIYIPANRSILFGGTSDTGEGNDRESLDLPRGQQAIGEMLVEKCDNLVVFNYTNSIVDVDWATGKADAILWASYLGSKQGSALANVLFGATNPSGHLSTTWYGDESQLAELQHDYTIYDSDGEGTDDYGRTYMHFTGEIDYPFGYGLSYTTFEYSNLTIDKTSVTGDDTIKVSVTVKNTGSVAGADVVQIYAVGPKAAAANRPDLQLVAFDKVSLAPNQSQTVTMEVDMFDLSYWNEDTDRFEMDLGNYVFTARTDSATLAIENGITVNCTKDATPVLKAATVKIPGFILPMNGTATAVASASLINDTLYATASEMPKDMTVVYTSSNEAVAKVSADGVITPVAEGVCSITATITDGATKTTLSDSHPVVVVAEKEEVPVEPPVEPEDPFTDVTSKNWFYDEVMAVYEAGLIDGMGDGTFAPRANVTRGQIVTVLYRMAGSPEVEIVTSFSDVAANRYYADAIAWAAQNGIAQGYPDGTFRPEESVIRQDMVVFLYRYAMRTGADISKSAELTFTDANEINSYAQVAVRWAVAYGIVNGMGDGTFAPKGTANRAQFATIIYNYIK